MCLLTGERAIFVCSSLAQHGLQCTGADRQWRLRASYLEVHNEDVWDLLGEDDRPLEVLEGAHGAVTVMGLREADVADEREMLSLLQVRRSCRVTAPPRAAAVHTHRVRAGTTRTAVVSTISLHPSMQTMRMITRGEQLAPPCSLRLDVMS